MLQRTEESQISQNTWHAYWIYTPATDDWPLRSYEANKTGT